MLLRFGVSNHRSIRDYQEVHFTAAPRIRSDSVALQHVRTVDSDVIPVLALYGPNASGKSNLLDAIDEFRMAVVHSHAGRDEDDHIPRSPFALQGSFEELPTRFDCTFSVPPDKKVWPSHSELVFEYGFEFDEKKFSKEWLVQLSRKERLSSRLLFERKTVDGKTEIRFGASLKGENRTIANLTRSNSLFLSAATQNNHDQLRTIASYLRRSWEVRLSPAPKPSHLLAKELLGFKHKDVFQRLLRQADLGITSIEVESVEADEKAREMMREVMAVFSKYQSEAREQTEEMSEDELDKLMKMNSVSFTHAGSDGTKCAFKLESESQGTRTLATLLIPALNALHSGGFLVIDELDTSLHPRLAKAFVSLFCQRESNPLGAQLAFSTHDVALLSSGILRNDQIVLTDKQRDGSTCFTPLTDFSLRSRDNIERAYREGRLGGVPVSDEFDVRVLPDPTN